MSQSEQKHMMEVLTDTGGRTHDVSEDGRRTTSPMSAHGSSCVSLWNIYNKLFPCFGCWLLVYAEPPLCVFFQADRQRGGQVGNAEMGNEELTEELTEEQLDLILRFNDAIVDLQHRQAPREQGVGQNNLQNPIQRLASSVQPLPRGEDVPDHDSHAPSDEDNNSWAWCHDVVSNI